jgi:hypothetical protein
MPDLRSAELASAFDVTLVVADPPRASRFALFCCDRPSEETFAGTAEGPAECHGDTVPVAGMLELVIPGAGASARLRRRLVPAGLVPVGIALDFLLDARPGEATPSALAWSAVLTAGLGLVARGRLQPAATASGSDAWKVGPLDPADLRLLEALSAAMPPLGHCVVVPGVSPLRVTSPRALVRAAWDALADSLVRTAAAGTATGATGFAATEVTDVTDLRPWLDEATGATGDGASVSLRVEFGGRPAALSPDNGRATTEGTAGRAVLQMTSVTDPSLVVDAGDLFAMPAVVLARYGEAAERDLLLALRRGGRVWPPLGALLSELVPSALPLDDDLMADLLLDGTEALQEAGIEVLWPVELVSDQLRLRAVATPTPGAVVGSGLDLGSMLEFRWEIALGGEALTEEELAALAEAKRGVVRLRGRFVVADPALIARAADRRARRVTAAEALGALLAGKVELDGELVDVGAEGSLLELAERLRAVATPGVAELAVPARLEAELRPYQRRGMAWLQQMTELGLGACLADDMGLGKTIQVIALHLLRAQDSAGPTLVVCPTSLLGNWERELNRFAPSVPVRRFHGGSRHLDDLAADEVVLTTYGVLRRERERICEAGLSMVVADEVQHAKNPLSETARALRAVPSAARVALTGTPVENRLTELWSILDWTTPGLLGPLERFRRTVAVAVERNRDPEATERLASVVRPFLLRRRKTDPTIAPELPARTVTDLPVPLTTEQATLYEAEVREALAAIEEKSGIARQGLVLRLLTVLKQICNHPAQYLHQAGPLPGRSGKLAALDELSEVILSAGDSVLVFSQFVEMCSLIEAHLAERGVATLFLHGGVPAKRREEMVATFQAGDVPVFLLSLKAGGVGLNLTQATHVIHYDRWWNPAVEDQASDRAHRIGQRRAVQIHRLICEGTVEDRIAQILERKRSLAETIVGEGESWIGDLSNDDLAELVRLGAPGEEL